MSVVIGIDPGQHTGVAVFQDGVLVRLHTLSPHKVTAWLAQKPRDVVVVFEDSRLQSHVWNADGKRGSLRIARNLGMVDAICAQIEAWCRDEDVRCAPVSPKGKGSKLDAAAFKHLTGWPKRANQHERDAALLAWPFRNLTPKKLQNSATEALPV